MDLEVIERIPINIGLEDKIIWHYDKTGKYMVKSGYKLFMNNKINEASSSSYPMGNVWKNLWKLKIPSKIKIFYWKVLHEIIPTNRNLSKRGVSSSSICPMR